MSSGNACCDGRLPVVTIPLPAVDAQEMKGQGAVRCLLTRSHADRHRMLVLHEETGVIIWDLR